MDNESREWKDNFEPIMLLFLALFQGNIPPEATMSDPEGISDDDYRWTRKEISNWLAVSTTNWHAYKVLRRAIISFAWFHGVDDSRLMRLDKEISKWIAASTTDWHAYKGLQRLYKTLRKHNQTIPKELLYWAADAHGGRLKKPKRKRGRDGLQNVLRDRFIVIGVKALEVILGIPVTSIKAKRSACHLVAKRMNLSYEAVCTIWRSRKWDELKKAYGLYLQTGNKKLLSPGMSVMGLNIFNWR